MPLKIRLQKYCSERGICSRRKAEEYIKKGWIKVNGKVVTELGTKVENKDIVELDPKAKAEQKEYLYVLLNKPVGYVTNLPNGDEKEAKELLPESIRDRVHAVGRLDKDSEGLLLFTNDGVAANRLSSPVYQHEKEYEVTVDRHISNDAIKQYAEGITILGLKTKPVEVKRIGGKTYQFILREGKNRQIRRMLNSLGYNVLKLKRVRISEFRLGDLGEGKALTLTPSPGGRGKFVAT
ncbi:MAG: rRNA pseudouridine synthase [Candidatus Saganbacteria bacterium]|nr:rRNA pseudouridine synthase [Candidatus Saganbacteria bacterium]